MGFGIGSNSLFMLPMGLKKQKPEFHKREYVYFKNLTYVVTEVKMIEGEYVYRIKIPGNLIAFWTSGSDLRSKRISEPVTIKNFFKGLK